MEMQVANGVDSNPDPPPTKYGPKEHRRMMKNIIFISISFTLLFLAHSSMATLQSTINSDGGLGVYSLSTVYGAIVITALVAPSIVIKKLTVKWTIALSMAGYLINMGLQFEPMWATLIPGGAIVGFSASLLWAAKSTYLTHVGYEYSKLTGIPSERIIVRFFGIFFMFFQSNKIWGNLISSLVLRDPDEKSEINQTILDLCGFHFCPGDIDNPNLDRPSDAKIYTLTTIFLCSVGAAICVVSFLVDPMSRYGENERESKNNRNMLVATFTHMKKPFQILIIPLTIWSGIEQGFIEADYTQAYIGCALGVENIGFVFICFGVFDAAGSLALGQVIRFVGRVPVFIAGALLNYGLIIFLMKWKPDPDMPIIFYAIIALWGIADAIWQTQINALYGVLFPNEEEASFSNYRLWESLGFILAYVNTELLCIDIKLYILLGTITAGMGGYLILEFLIRKQNKKSNI